MTKNGGDMFQKATKKKAKLRMAIMGPAKSGKSFSSLKIAKNLGRRVAAIDTERGSLSKYAGDVADFDVVELTSFAPARYIAAMKAAADAGYDVLLVDSISHAWVGEGGLLDQKDKAGGNSFNAWRTLTPQHNEFVDTILGWPGHIIVTMRVKTEYVVEQVGGKSVPRRVGLAPVQRDGMEYEFDVLAEMDRDHTLHVTDTRCPALDGAALRKPDGAEIARTLLAWLDDGAEVLKAPAALDPVSESARLVAEIDGIANAAALGVVRDRLNANPPKLPRPLLGKVREAMDRAKARVAELEYDDGGAMEAEAEVIHAGNDA